MVQIVASHCEPFSSAPYSALLAQLQVLLPQGSHGTKSYAACDSKDVVLRGHRRASVLMRALRSRVRWRLRWHNCAVMRVRTPGIKKIRKIPGSGPKDRQARMKKD